MPSTFSHFPACRSEIVHSRASRTRHVLDALAFLAGLALFSAMLFAGCLASVYLYP